MATTATSQGNVDWGDGHLVTASDLTTIEPGATLNVAHNGPSGAAVLRVTWETTVAPTTRDIISVSHIRASDSTANNTCRILVDTIAGGDLGGAKVRLFFHFREAASGGIS